MPLSGSIEDRLEILELYARYASTSSRSDRQGWLTCWAEDAVWASHIFECVGKAAIAKQYDEIMAAFDKLHFISQAGPIEITGDTARAQSNAMEIACFKTGGFFKLAGNYEDRLVKRHGEWLFLRRDYQPSAQAF
jgi:ketosteroid isomerase-like protein